MPCLLEDQILEQVSSLITRAQNATSRHKTELSKVCDEHRESATNLIHYAEIRKQDLSSLQDQLGAMGLSRLARAEEHVLSSLLQAQAVLQCLLSPTSIYDNTEQKSLATHLEKNCMRTLGPPSLNRRARIMITMPSEAAHNEHLVEQMVRAGMNVARINCAHDNKKLWLAMIRNIRKVSADLHQPVKIIMDLAGPKLRAQLSKKGLAVMKIKPTKNDWGQVTAPARIPIEITCKKTRKGIVPFKTDLDSSSLEHKTLKLVDTRGKKRSIKIIKEKNQLLALFNKTTYLKPNIKLTSCDLVSETIQIGNLPEQEASIDLRVGDYVCLVDPDKYDSADLDEKVVNCTLPEAVAALVPGHKIYFDDGKIHGKVVDKAAHHVVVQITQTDKPISKLKGDKGINLPDTPLPFTGLTEKDQEDLRFIIQHADGVHVSFISTPADVTQVIERLKQLNTSSSFGMILKIENKSAFTQMRNILLEAMKWRTVGVTIARGDLAVETGWENIGRLQKEIIKLANAAHLPVIWATQVLDNLAKNGFPLRSEITDAASSIRADCVMLNKGPYIIKTIDFLDQLLEDTELYQKKNMAMLPRMLDIQ